MPNPIPPWTITTPYGTPGAWAAGFHTGDDYSTHGKVGYGVYATHRARVVSARGIWGGAYGLHVVVLSPFLRVQTGYCHLGFSAVHVGQLLHAGDLIGYSGDTGRTTGPHLHYEERRFPYRYRDSRRPRFNRRSR